MKCKIYKSYNLTTGKLKNCVKNCDGKVKNHGHVVNVSKFFARVKWGAPQHLSVVGGEQPNHCSGYCCDRILFLCCVTVKDRSCRTITGVAIFRSSYSSYHSEIGNTFPPSISNKQGSKQNRTVTNVCTTNVHVTIYTALCRVA